MAVRIAGYHKIQRRYPDNDWDYSAINVKILDDGKRKSFVYYILKNEGKVRDGVEIYSGENYLVGEGSRSHSRRYKVENTPMKYKEALSYAIKKYGNQTWSKEKYVNDN